MHHQTNHTRNTPTQILYTSHAPTSRDPRYHLYLPRMSRLFAPLPPHPFVHADSLRVPLRPEPARPLANLWRPLRRPKLIIRCPSCPNHPRRLTATTAALALPRGTTLIDK